MTVAARSCIYTGQVMHKRLKPVRHRFIYRVFSLLLDLDELRALNDRVTLFSVERFNLLSFSSRDHGPRDGTSLRLWADGRFAAAGLARPDQLFLLCFPRILGYVFNPLSIYFGYDRNGELSGVIYQVKNTFGEQHCYMMPADQDQRKIRQTCKKSFYVSPFIAMEATYHFKIDLPGERLLVSILQTMAQGPLLVATQQGVRRPLCDSEILRCLATNGLMTLKVTAGIHWEALWLWLKRVPLIPRTQSQRAADD